MIVKYTMIRMQKVRLCRFEWEKDSKRQATGLGKKFFKTQLHWWSAFFDDPDAAFDETAVEPAEEDVLPASIQSVKYVDSSALNRIEQEFERNDVNISRQTMSNISHQQNGFKNSKRKSSRWLRIFSCR